MSFHYKYGGSTAKRTLNCPGWRALADSIDIIDVSSEHADRGTMLHTCCEILEDDGLSYAELLEKGVEYEGQVLTEELLEEKVIPAFEAMEDFVEDHGFTTVVTEELLEYNDIIGGTPDLLMWSLAKIGCGDYKFGDGVMVFADDNDQMFFAVWIALVCDVFKVDLDPDMPVEFAIIQPSDKRENTLDVWETTIEAVENFGERFLDAVNIAENSEPGENLNDGDWCKFCKGAGICPKKGDKARKALALIASPELKDNIKIQKTGETNDLTIPVLDLSDALILAKQLEPWIKDVRTFAFNILSAGGDIPGHKLVKKRATRKWIDPEATAEYLKRKLTAKVAMKLTVISPKQAEDAAKKAKVVLRMKDRTISESSGNTIALEGDKREAVPTQKGIAEALKKIAE